MSDAGQKALRELQARRLAEQAKQIPPAEPSPQRVPKLEQWRQEYESDTEQGRALRAEFLTAAAYCGYMRAFSEGRVRFVRSTVVTGD
jgi:hypothetical protein